MTARACGFEGEMVLENIQDHGNCVAASIPMVLHDGVAAGRVRRGDRVLRLFRRGRARFSDDVVHERLLCEGTQARLPGLLLHDSVDSPEDAREKTERYARLGAQRLRERGRGGLIPALTHAAWTFLRGYLLRLGLLDGRAGLAIATLNARGTYLRYRLAGLPASASPTDGDPR